MMPYLSLAGSRDGPSAEGAGSGVILWGVAAGKRARAVHLLGGCAGKPPEAPQDRGVPHSGGKNPRILLRSVTILPTRSRGGRFGGMAVLRGAELIDGVAVGVGGVPQLRPQERPPPPR